MKRNALALSLAEPQKTAIFSKILLRLARWSGIAAHLAGSARGYSVPKAPNMDLGGSRKRRAHQNNFGMEAGFVLALRGAPKAPYPTM